MSHSPCITHSNREENTPTKHTPLAAECLTICVWDLEEQDPMCSLFPEVKDLLWDKVISAPCLLCPPTTGHAPHITPPFSLHCTTCSWLCKKLTTDCWKTFICCPHTHINLCDASFLPLPAYWHPTSLLSHPLNDLAVCALIRKGTMLDSYLAKP